MRTKFWRFAYAEEQLDTILGSDGVYFPDLKQYPAAKNNSEEKILSDLRVGNYILLANYNLTTEIGTVRGVGKITDIQDGRPTMLWKKPIPSWSLTPDKRGGVKEWRGEGVFCFDENPARRYKLSELTKKLFRDA